MSNKSQQTFREILLTAGPMSAEILERKANIAALLARCCPEYRDVLRALETNALHQMFRIMTSTATHRVLSHSDQYKGFTIVTQATGQSDGVVILKQEEA